jgi:hypothetical protein
MISCPTSGTRVEVNMDVHLNTGATSRAGNHYPSEAHMFTSTRLPLVWHEIITLLKHTVMISCLTSGTRVEVNMCASEG